MNAPAALAGASGRVMHFSVDPETARLVLGIAGGATGASAVKSLFGWWRRRHREKKQEPVAFTARILDDGDELRRVLLDEAKAAREREDKALERAHQAELAVAKLEPEILKLHRRLTERDAQLKALQVQITGLGAAPVVPVSSHAGGGAET